MRKLDMAWINGNIYTADDKFSTAAAFGVSGDRFSVVGSTEEVLENCDEHTKIIDLQGKTVLPGLIDAHLHITNTGAMKLNLNLVSKQKQEILDMVADAYNSAKKGEWIIGRGWINDTWDDPSFPTKEDLDAVAPDSPVYLTRACGHAAWANTKAFETAGITKDTPDPAGGEFLHKQDGSLLGVVTDQAQDPFNKAIPSYTKEQIQKIVLLAQQEFFSNGLTSVQDAGSPEEWVEAWQELYEKERLKLRIYVSMRVLGRPNYQELMEGSLKFFKKGLRIGMYDNRLTARAYKISLDGSLGARSAWMLEDYEDQPGHKGNGKWTNDQLYSVLYEARRAGFQTWCHAIGDAANRQCLDVYEQLLKELDECLNQLEKLIIVINKTNMAVVSDGELLSDLLAKRDVLKLRIASFQNTISIASNLCFRSRGDEIRQLSAVDVKALQKKVDALSRDYRILDNRIQAANWTADLIEE